MNIYTNNSFTGVYPVGTAAIVVAPTSEAAALALNSELIQRGLPGDAKVEDMMTVNPAYLEVRILNDGDY